MQIMRSSRTDMLLKMLNKLHGQGNYFEYYKVCNRVYFC